MLFARPTILLKSMYRGTVMLRMFGVGLSIALYVSFSFSAIVLIFTVTLVLWLANVDKCYKMKNKTRTKHYFECFIWCV